MFGNYQKQKVIFYFAVIGLLFIGVCALMTTLYSFANITNMQSEMVGTSDIVYDIYKEDKKLVTVEDLRKIKMNLLKKFNSKLSSGNELYFGEGMNIVERYRDKNDIISDETEAYKLLETQGVFEVAAVKIVIQGTDKSYIVANDKVWNDATTKIKEVVNHKLNGENSSATVELEGYDEKEKIKSNIHDILSEGELITKIMQPENNMYQVESGDTLETIAMKTQTTPEELLVLNPGIEKQSLLVSGAAINIASSEYSLSFSNTEVIEREEKLLYDIEYIDDDQKFVGDDEIIQEGVDGVKLVQYNIKRTTNGEEIILSQETLRIIQEPVVKKIRRGTKEAVDYGTGDLLWPSAGRRVSAEYMDPTYGYGPHYGIDINDRLNGSIYAADNGVVVETGYNGGYGNFVVINHNNGIWTLYAHLNETYVRTGEIVPKGTVIGGMGSSGFSTGVHLHFEVREGSNTKSAAINPRNYIS